MKEAVEAGELVMLGVVQEQHPDRTRLYAQWQQFGWSILHDPINVIETSAVPMFVAIDEHGIVRSTRPRVDNFAETFLNVEFTDEADATPPPALTAGAHQWQTYAPHFQASDATEKLMSDVGAERAAEMARGYADGLTLWGESAKIPAWRTKAITTYELANSLDAKPLTRFRQGVAHRMRYESPAGEPADFQRAIDLWNSALGEDPNQYIWRRRIQQYGPRLIKPYPFYDWVETAREEISARGETPEELSAELTLAEIAAPARGFTEEAAGANPDPEGKIARDEQSLIHAETTVVSSADRDGVSATIHFTFTPDETLKAHWNNEGEPQHVWIDPPQGWKVTRQLLEAPQGDAAETNEVRRLAVEIRSDAPIDEPVSLSAYTLYNVCEDLGGVCIYLRQDLKIEVAPPSYRNR